MRKITRNIYCLGQFQKCNIIGQVNVVIVFVHIFLTGLENHFAAFAASSVHNSNSDSEIGDADFI